MISLTSSYDSGDLDGVQTHADICRYSHCPINSRIDVEIHRGTKPSSDFVKGKGEPLRYAIDGADYTGVVAETSGTGNNMAAWLNGLCKWLSDNKTELAGTIVALLLFMPAIAGAAEEATVSSGTQTALDIYALLGGVITALLTWVGHKMQAYLATKTKNETVNGLLSRAGALAMSVVKEIHQVEANAIRKAKSPSSPGGSKITSAEAEDLKNIAVNRLKSHIGVKGLQEMMTVLGLDSSGVGGLLGTLVESAVHDSKAPAADPK